MNFFRTKIAVGWAILISAIPWLLLFLFGTGAYWEYNKMPLVTFEIGHKVAELHQKKAAAFQDVLTPEMAATPSDSPVLKAKIDQINALEKTISQLERRPPVIYARRTGNLKQPLGDAKVKAEGTVRDAK